MRPLNLPEAMARSQAAMASSPEAVSQSLEVLVARGSAYRSPAIPAGVAFPLRLPADDHFGVVLFRGHLRINTQHAVRRPVQRPLDGLVVKVVCLDAPDLLLLLQFVPVHPDRLGQQRGIVGLGNVRHANVSLPENNPHAKDEKH